MDFKKPKTVLAEDNQEFLNIHEVLADAALESQEKEADWTTTSFRIPERLKSSLDQICKSHGTNSSVFLRKCCEYLVRDYNPSNH